MLTFVGQILQVVLLCANPTIRSWVLWRDPFNQNYRAEALKFLGVEWIATGPNGLVPLHSQNEFRAHFKMQDVGSLLLVSELDEDFDGDINGIVWAVSCAVI